MPPNRTPINRPLRGAAEWFPRAQPLCRELEKAAEVALISG